MDIPTLSADVEILPFDNSTFLIQQNKYKHQLRVSELTYQVLSLVNNSNSVSDIEEILIDKGYKISQKQIIDLLYNSKLATYGIIKTEKQVSYRQSNNYLHFKITLLNSRILRYVLPVFSWMFTPKFFYLGTILMLLFDSYVIFYFYDFKSLQLTINPENITLLYCLFYLSTLLHEMGHVSACHYFGAKPGRIGIGIYLIMPVFFADVSDAWRVSSKSRVIIDLGGLYLELFLCTCICIAFLLTNNLVLLTIAILIILRTYINLNPFLRMDGYWALADLTNTPNLWAKSHSVLSDFFSWIFKDTRNPISNLKNLLLLLYAFICQLFITYVFVKLFYYNFDIVLKFPFYLYDFSSNIYNSFPSINFNYIRDTAFSFLPALIVYLILFRYLRTRLINVILYNYFKLKNR
jgi:putative peptide zinc metalloprotease protein